MQANREALIQDIKNDVMADLQRTNYQMNSQYSSPYSSPYFNSVSSNGNYHMNNGQYLWPKSNSYNLNPHNDAITDSIRRELLAEIEAQRASRMAEAAGYGQLLSDQKLNKLIDQRYRTLEDVKNEIRRELQSIQKMETGGAGSDPYIREIAQAIAMEARQQGVPIDQVTNRMDGKNSNGTGTGLWGRMSHTINVGQRKGFLYGLGAAALVYLLLPIARNNLHSVAVRSMEEGMSFAERARSFVNRNKDEDFSDGLFDEKKTDIDTLDE